MMTVSFYQQDDDYTEWDALVAASHAGTFLHTRKFLNYHNDRFQDKSLVLRSDAGKLLAILPAALNPQDDKQVVSHPGATFGGLLFQGRGSYEFVEALMSRAVGFYRHHGFRSFLYKTVPTPFHVRLMELDKYYLWRNGASLVRRDLWNVVLLNDHRKLSKGRKWGINRKQKEEFTIARSVLSADIDAFHQVLTACLEQRHSAEPVHSAEEMRVLMDKFPDAIELWLIRDPCNQVLAGVWIFNANGHCPHSQYIATTEAGRESCAGDILIGHVIDLMTEKGASHFSFGSSTEDQGKHLNSGLFTYKSGYGVGSIVHDFYQMAL